MISDKAYENDISTLITIEISYKKLYISNMSTLYKQNPPNQFLKIKNKKSTMIVVHYEISKAAPHTSTRIHYLKKLEGQLWSMKSMPSIISSHSSLFFNPPTRKIISPFFVEKNKLLELNYTISAMWLN